MIQHLASRFPLHKRTNELLNALLLLSIYRACVYTRAPIPSGGREGADLQVLIFSIVNGCRCRAVQIQRNLRCEWYPNGIEPMLDQVIQELAQIVRPDSVYDFRLRLIAEP